MTIDYTPAIKAFAEARIKQLHPSQGAAINELQMIITICNGLMKQSEIFQESLQVEGLAESPEQGKAAA